MLRVILFILLCCWAISDTYAKTMACSDSLSVIVYYPCGSSSLSMLPGNIHSLKLFIQQLDSLCQSPFKPSVSLFVTSSTSPDGSLRINQSLADHRNQSVKHFLLRHSMLFRNGSTPIDYKEYRLTTNHLLQQIPRSAYSSLRYSKLTLFLDSARDSLLILEAPPTLLHTQTLYSAEVLPPEKIAEVPFDFNQQPMTDRRATPSPLLWVKSNLLYDLLTCVNVSVEVPLSKQLTTEATLVYPWWRSTARHKTLQLRYVALTPRYYFNRHAHRYTSLFMGLAIGGGKYDLQWTRRGVQGSMWHLSPVIGYSHPISKRWKMEYSASVGFVHTTYQKYTQTPDTPYGEIKVKDYPWVSKVLNTVLPTSLNVSIVYTFTKSKQIGHHEE